MLHIEFAEQGAIVTLAITASKTDPATGDIEINHLGSVTLSRKSVEPLLAELLDLGVEVTRGTTNAPPPVLDGDARVKVKSKP